MGNVKPKPSAELVLPTQLHQQGGPEGDRTNEDALEDPLVAPAPPVGTEVADDDGSDDDGAPDKGGPRLSLFGDDPGGPPAAPPPDEPADDPKLPGLALTPALLGAKEAEGPSEDTEGPGAAPAAEAAAEAMVPEGDAPIEEGGEEDAEQVGGNTGSLDGGGGGVAAEKAGATSADGVGAAATDGGGDVGAGSGPDQGKGTGAVDEGPAADESVEAGGETDTMTAATEAVDMGDGNGPTLGLDAFTVPDVAKLPEATLDAIKDETGRSLEQHRSVIESHVSGLMSNAVAMQAAAVSTAMSFASSVSGLLEGGRATMLGKVSTARAAITGAIATARTTTGGAADAAITAIEGGRTTGLGAITTASNNSKAAAKTFYETQSAKYATMDTAMLEPFKTLLDGKAAATRKDGGTKATSFAGLDVGSAVKLGSGTPLEQYVASARQTWMTKDLEKAVKDMKTGVEARAVQLEGQLTPLHENIKGLLKPLVDKSNALGVEGEAAVDKARIAAETKLNADADTAVTTVNTARTGALTHLTTIEANANQQLDGLAANVNSQVDERATASEGAFTGAASQFAEQYRGFMGQTLEGFPSGGPVTTEVADDFLSEAAGGLSDMESMQNDQISGIHADTTANFTEAIGLTGGSVEQVQASMLGQVRQVTDTQVAGFGAVSTGFTGSLGQVGPSVTSAFNAWLSPVKGQLAAHETQVRGQNEKVKTGLDTTLGGQHTTWLSTLETTKTGYLAGASAKSYEGARPAEKKVEDRAKKAYQAMRGLGTDENKLFDALRSMAKLEPQATTHVFGRISGGESLHGWMRDELNDEEYSIASAHYNRNASAAARLEINYNVSFWGDDEAQIEKVLRGMPDDERAKIMGENKAEWASTLKLLDDNLDGNDLDVTTALVQNNVSKADAIRLKEKIDKARISRDDDAMHDALAGMDQKKIDEISAEFAKLDGVADAVDVPDGSGSRSIMSKYVTRDIDKPGRGRDRKLNTGASDYADALIMHGNDSVDTRVAKFKNEMDRRGGPNEEKLEQALYVNPGLKERLHNPDPKIREAAKKEAAAEQASFQEKFKTKYKTDASSVLGKEGLKDGKDDMFKLMMRDGYNSPDVAAKQIDIAVTGAGTDEDAIKRALNGMSKADIAATKETYAKSTGKNLEEALGVNGKDKSFFTELSGQDRIDVEILLMGDEKYMNDDERMALAEKKYDVQRGSESNGVGRAVMGSSYEAKALEGNMADLKKFRSDNADKFKDGKFHGTPEEYEDYRRKCRYVGITADLYQEQSDRVANYATTAIAVAGAVAATIATGGVAGPMLIAAATGVGSMGVNAAMKGGRYGWEDGAVDLGVTAVNVVTAGVGSKITAGIDKGYEAGKLSTKALIAQKAFVEGTKGSVETMASTSMQDKTWKNGLGKGLKEVGGGGAKAFATGFITTGATEGLSKVDIPGGGLADYKGKGTLEKLGSADNSLGFNNKIVDKTLSGAAAMTTQAGMGAVGGVINKGTDISIDAAFGKYKGEFYNAAEDIGMEGLKGAGTSFLQGGAAVGKENYKQHKANKAAKATAETEAITENQKKAEHDLKDTQQEHNDKLEAELKKVEGAKVVEEGNEKIDPVVAPEEDKIKAKVVDAQEKIHNKGEETKKKVDALEEEKGKVIKDMDKVEPTEVEAPPAVEETAPVVKKGGEKDKAESEALNVEVDEVDAYLLGMIEKGTLTEEAYRNLKKNHADELGSFVADEKDLLRIIDKLDSKAITEADADDLLDMDADGRKSALESLDKSGESQTTAVVPKEGDGVKPGKKPGRRKVVRQDNDFNAPTVDKGKGPKKKSHINADGDLVPADPTGDLSKRKHVRGGADDKEKSPYTSFATEEEGVVSKKYGDHEIEVDVDRLRADIESGAVTDVTVVDPDTLQKDLMDAVSEITDHLDHDELLRLVDVAVAEGDVSGLTTEVLKDVALSKKKTKSVESRLRDLYNSRRDMEWLLEGVIPAEYIKGPYPVAKDEP